MGVVTSTYPCLSHLYTCTQIAKCACVHTLPHTQTLTFHVTHYTPYALHRSLVGAILLMGGGWSLRPNLDSCLIQKFDKEEG